MTIMKWVVAMPAMAEVARFVIASTTTTRASLPLETYLFVLTVIVYVRP